MLREAKSEESVTAALSEAPEKAEGRPRHFTSRRARPAGDRGGSEAAIGALGVDLDDEDLSDTPAAYLRCMDPWRWRISGIPRRTWL
jgi:hypothetical protein